MFSLQAVTSQALRVKAKSVGILNLQACLQDKIVTITTKHRDIFDNVVSNLDPRYLSINSLDGYFFHIFKLIIHAFI